jgi:hypothetical protein
MVVVVVSVVVVVLVVGAAVLVVVGIVVLVVVVVPHTFGSDAPHVSGAGQVPQLTTSSQSSVNVPQSKPSLAQVCIGVQPQWPAVPPPPQVSGAVQAVPQAPQLLESVARLTQTPLQSLSPAGQQRPNSATPCLTVGLAQFLVQQLMLVWHCWPFGLHGLACAAETPMASAAARTTRRSAFGSRNI